MARWLALVVALVAAPAVARADVNLLVEVGYVAPACASLLTTTVNGAFLAYDQGAPWGWRIAGYVSGGVEVGVGVTVLALAGDTTAGKVLGVVPLVLGSASLATAFFVDDELVLGPASSQAPGEAMTGLSLSGRW